MNIKMAWHRIKYALDTSYVIIHKSHFESSAPYIRLAMDQEKELIILRRALRTALRHYGHMVVLFRDNARSSSGYNIGRVVKRERAAIHRLRLIAYKKGGR